MLATLIRAGERPSVRACLESPRAVSVDSDSQDSFSGFALIRYNQLRKEDIKLHKWYMSERVGYDIGWEKAKADWTAKGYETLLRRRFQEQLAQGFGLVAMAVA